MVVVKKEGSRRVEHSGEAVLSNADVAEGNMYSARRLPPAINIRDDPRDDMCNILSRS